MYKSSSIATYDLTSPPWLELFKGKTIAWFATGSTVICPAHRTIDSDYDYVVLVFSTSNDWLPYAVWQAGFKDLGWISGAGGKDHGLSRGGKWFRSIKRYDPDPENLILTDSVEFFGRMKLATELATQLVLTDKTERVDFFNSMVIPQCGRGIWPLVPSKVVVRNLTAPSTKRVGRRADRANR